jgi:excisionase family DNA binding protein
MATPGQLKVNSHMGLDDILVAKLAHAISAEIVKCFPESGASHTVQPALLSVKEAAVYLGRTEQSIQHLIFERTVPVVRVGRRIHLHRSDLDRWIEKNKF